MICKRKDCPYNTGIKCGRITPINNELGICSYIYTSDGQIKAAAFKHTKEEVSHDLERLDPAESGSAGVHQNDEAIAVTSEAESGSIQQTTGRSESGEVESTTRTSDESVAATAEEANDK